MYNIIPVTEHLYYLGGNDRRIALFESAYPVPHGVSYNSYLLLDEKTVLFDTVDRAVSETFFENLEHALNGRKLDYLVVHHMEPDHSASFEGVLARHPETVVIVNKKTAGMLENFFGFHGESKVVSEGETISFGKHSLTFVFAPMVHWPEVMMSFLTPGNILFSADAFGTFGALGGSIFADEVHFERDFLDDARRYYCGIVGKYGVQVQSVLKKAAGLPIEMICPLHGPVWREKEGIGWFVGKYDTWSRCVPEEKGAVLFYASVYGHTQNAAEILGAELAKRGVPVKVYDVSVLHPSELLAEAFRYSHLVFLSTTYNNGIFVSMETFLHDLKAHFFKGRAFAVVENGSWSPQAGQLMETEISSWKEMRQIGDKVTLLSAVSETSRDSLISLADDIANDYKKS